MSEIGCTSSLFLEMAFEGRTWHEGILKSKDRYKVE